MPGWLIEWIYAARDLLAQIAASVHGFDYAKALFPLNTKPTYGTSLTDVLNHIHDMCVNIQSDVVNGTYGMAAAHTERQAILGAIAALPAGSDIVIPPGGASAADVWAYVNGATPAPGTYQVGAQLAETWGVLTELYRSGAWRVNGNPFFTVEWPGSPITNLSTSFAYPTPDWTAIGSYTSVVDWLNGTDTSGRTWSADADSGLATTYDTLAGEQWFAMRCLLRDTDLYPTAGVGAPIWPGLAGVTLGTTVPAVVSTVLELPMDGIIWLTTSYPPARARWGAAPYYSVYHTGRLAFITDNGDLEPFQYMGWQNSVFVPQTMRRAAGVVVFLEANIEGAITPWDISV